MKFICSKSDLLNGVNIVSKAVPNRSTMSILECILIDTTRDVISLTGNDTELGIETIIDGQIIERGIVALEAKIFSDIVRKFPDDDITIDVDQNYKTLISCGKSNITIIGKSGEDYTYLPDIENNNSIICLGAIETSSTTITLYVKDVFGRLINPPVGFGKCSYKSRCNV